MPNPLTPKGLPSRRRPAASVRKATDYWTRESALGTPGRRAGCASSPRSSAVAYHAQVALGLVVVERHAAVVQQPQHLVGVDVELGQELRRERAGLSWIISPTLRLMVYQAAITVMLTGASMMGER
jgi:hypothetical protein